MNKLVLERLFKKDILKRIFLERLTEPLHLNVIAAFVALFGSTRSKITFDLVVRQQYAFCLLNAADRAIKEGYKRVTAMEFGVANGAGLMNICSIAALVTKETGIEFDIYGFDTGEGMPPPKDYRDHPEQYFTGDFPMSDIPALKARLPANAHLILGPVEQTVPEFVKSLDSNSPIGFVVIDVDYYHSTVECLKVLEGAPETLQSCVCIYLDDITFEIHNSWSGELAAVREFNEAHDLRKIEPYNFLRTKRIFKNPKWIDHIFTLHVLDHPVRQPEGKTPRGRVLNNPFLQ